MVSEGACWRRGWLALAAVVILELLATLPVRSQPVLLRIRPRVGDTLHLRSEQMTEMIAQVHRGNADTSMSYRSSVLTISRMLILGYDETGTTVENITDSIAMTSSGGPAGERQEDARRALQGKRVRMVIGLDGSAVLLAAPDLPSSEDQSLLSQLPATLPKHAVAVGESWSETMDIPLEGQTTTDGSGSMRVTFRLDSLTRGGNYAWVSMRGTIARDAGAVPLPQGIAMTMSGSLTGSILVDRRTGWMADARTQMTVLSVFTPPPASGRQPMRVSTHITQRTHLLYP